MKTRIDAELDRLLPDKTPLERAARYSLLAPGKRLRPKLVLMTAEMLGTSIEKALQPACALEMIHAYSLIHDDLPCMDDDDFRRGQPTLHKAYDEATAVLVGDFLLTYAFEVLADSPNLSAEQKIELIRVLSQAAGGNGMIGGQLLDIQHKGSVEEMHEKKTAALFHAALRFGEIIAGVEDENLGAFGTQFGLLFQAVDDLLDEDHPLGQDEAKTSATRLLAQCHTHLASFSGQTAPFNALLSQISAQLQQLQHPCPSQ